MLLQVILEGLGLGILLVLVCAVGIRKGAVGMVHLYPMGQPFASIQSGLYELCAGLCLWDKRCKGLCSGFLAVTRHLVRYESHGPPVG